MKWKRTLRFGERERFMLQLVAPAVIGLSLFQILPILIGANASFRDWDLYDPKGTWVGLHHYKAVLSDPIFLGLVIPNTLLLMLLSVSISLSIGLGLALLLNRAFPGRALVQTVILLPLMVAEVIAATMFRWLFNDQFGIISVIVQALGFETPAWLVQRWPAFSIILLTDVWRWVPWFTILLLAGLQSLPKEPFEAAAIDGASRWRVFRFLTIPMLRPVMVVCIVIRSIDVFRAFDIVWIISGGGPARQTETFSVYAYIEAFNNLDFARGSAAAVIGTIMIVILGIVFYRMITRVVEVSR